jgi:DNA helicase II / ATP-dependent DNA helicase PcrA
MKHSALPSSFDQEIDAGPAQSDVANAFLQAIRPRLSVARNLTLSQQTAAAEAGPILVLAGAGTGKTSTLTEAVVRRIAHDGFSPARILAVTFTNKAAAEMANRIRSALGEEAAPSWLGTYHGLAARQLREAPEIAETRLRHS